jgi:hypothetical protein
VQEDVADLLPPLKWLAGVRAARSAKDVYQSSTGISKPNSSFMGVAMSVETATITKVMASR